VSNAGSLPVARARAEYHHGVTDVKARQTLTLAHSPDPDDVFMWWPITGKIDPVRNDDRGYGIVVEPARLDTGRLAFRALAEDIAVLNRRAIAQGDLEITAMSMFTWTHCRERYQLTACGSSMGEGYGPKVVSRQGAAKDGGGGGARTVAVPGVKTTAYLLWRMWEAANTSPEARSPHPAGNAPVTVIELPFDQITSAVASGRADQGLLIHQSQLTYSDLGLEQLVDLGQWWGERTGLPLPLGGNAVRRDLDDRFGPGTTRAVVALLDRSIRFALKHREESVRYAMRFAPELTRGQAERYIEMYVSPQTVDIGERGVAAMRRLFDEGADLALCPRVPEIDVLRAE